MNLKMLFSKIDLRNNLKWFKIKLKTKCGILMPCWLKYKLLLTTFEGCDSWGREESDTTERLIWSDLIWQYLVERMELPRWLKW